MVSASTSPSSSTSLCTSLTKPQSSLQIPGKCIFNEEWKSSKLLSKKSIGKNTQIFTFELPSQDKPLDLSTCACILAKGDLPNEKEPIIRPYTPISTNNLIGKMELMIKIYPDGKLSQYLYHLPIGESIDFKHIDFNVKIQYPFNKKKLGMICGGTGITPFIQALHALLGTEGDETDISMLYGSRSSDDILGGDTMNDWAAQSNGRFKCTHVLSHEPEDSKWSGERGHIDKDKITKFLPKPSDDCMIFVCGPPPMYDALCGPRTEKTVTGVLKDLGYSDEMVFKF
jgi:cytochrome-b5 reductase